METKTTPPEVERAPDAAPAARCPNCGAALRGRYCHDCGQEQRARIRPVGALLRDGIGTFLSLDFRIVPTLRRLLFAPGRLTEAYLQGQRARFTKPFRLYLLVSAVYFFISQVVMPEGILLFGGAFRMTGDDALTARRWLPRVMFVLVPIFALMMKLAYLRTRRLYAEHLIFSLHYFSFYFALSLLGALYRKLGQAALRTLAQGADSPTWLATIVAVPLVLCATVVPATYLALATRRVYGHSTGRAVACGIGLFVGQLALLTALMAALAATGIFQ